MRKTQLISAGALASFLMLAGVASAASNPSVTGQPGAPNVSCGSGNATVEPNGFTTSGFAHAETVYAGSPGTPSLANGNSHALAQYDIACYQQTAK